MSESQYVGPHLFTSETISPETNNFRRNFFEKLISLGQDPPGGDQITAAILNGLKKDYDEHGISRKLIDSFLFLRYSAETKNSPDKEKYEMSRLVGIARSCVTDYLLSIDPNFPRTDVNDYRNPVVIAALLSEQNNKNHNVAIESLALNLLTKEVQTSFQSRSGPIDFALSLFFPNASFDVDQLDVATSNAIVPRQQLLKQHPGLEHDDVTILEPQIVKNAEIPVTEVENSDMTRRVGQLMQRSGILNQIIATDILPSDEASKRFSIACLRPDTELGNQYFMNKFHKLLSEPVENLITIWRTNFTNPEEVDNLDRLTNIQKYDFISVSMLLNQLNLEERTAVIYHAIKRLKPDGKLHVQDFLYTAGKIGLRKLTNWSPDYQFGAFIYDNSHPEMGFQELLRCKDNSRCLNWQLGKGKFYLNDKLLSVPSLINAVT